MNTPVEKWFQLFDKAGKRYIKLVMEPAWRWFNDGQDPIDAIRLFVECYASQRQQANPEIYHCGADTLEEFKNNHQGLTGNEVWDRCVKRWRRYKGSDPNVLARNSIPMFPLYHDGMRCNNNQKRCLICLLRKEQNGISNLINEIVEMLNTNSVQESYRRLISVFGVGDKIACFFLRDIAVKFGIEIAGIKQNDLQYLQPVDIWVRRIAVLHKEDSNIKRWIIENSKRAGVNSLRVNMGMWYFASQIATTEYRLCRLLEDINQARKYLRC